MAERRIAPSSAGRYLSRVPAPLPTRGKASLEAIGGKGPKSRRAPLWVFLFLFGPGWGIFDLRLALVMKLLAATVMTLVLIRFGLLALVASAYAAKLLGVPLTLDPSSWYFPDSLVPLGVLVGLAGWAAWCSLGEQPNLASLLREEPVAAVTR